MPHEHPGLPLLLLSQDLQGINLWDTWVLPQGHGVALRQGWDPSPPPPPH